MSLILIDELLISSDDLDFINQKGEVRGGFLFLLHVDKRTASNYNLCRKNYVNFELFPLHQI